MIPWNRKDLSKLNAKNKTLKKRTDLTIIVLNSLWQTKH